MSSLASLTVAMMAAAMTRVEAKRSRWRSSASLVFALFISPMQNQCRRIKGESHPQAPLGKIGEALRRWHRPFERQRNIGYENMSANARKFGLRLGLIVAFLVAFEAFIVLRWTFFNGREPSLLHDVQTGLELLICIWAATKVGEWFERREARNNEIADKVRKMDARLAGMDIRVADKDADMDTRITDKLRNMDTRIEALYKWGGLRLPGYDQQDNDDWESDLDAETEAEIAKYRESGHTIPRYSLEPVS